MREWVDHTTSRILATPESSARGPSVLEIGCGTGMLLFRVAPHCSRYVGVDFSEAALVARRVADRVATAGPREARAVSVPTSLDALGAEAPFDLVVINSVIQYFPDVDYLAKVLEAAYARLAPGGALFVGDVRSLRHLTTFHESVELARASDTTTIAELKARVSRRAARGGRAGHRSAAFRSARATLAGLRGPQGRIEGRSSQKRDDAVPLRRGSSQERAIDERRRRNAGTDGCSAATLQRPGASRSAARRARARSRGGRPERQARGPVKAGESLLSDDGSAAVGDCAWLQTDSGDALDPEDVRAIDPAYDVQVVVQPGASRLHGRRLSSSLGGSATRDAGRGPRGPAARVVHESLRSGERRAARI